MARGAGPGGRGGGPRPGAADRWRSPGSTVYADEAAHWDVLHARSQAKRINHSFAFSDDGSCTNQVESYFARLRRAEIGQHHHISGPYLRFYAGERAWREDTRREDKISGSYRAKRENILAFLPQVKTDQFLKALRETPSIQELQEELSKRFRPAA